MFVRHLILPAFSVLFSHPAFAIVSSNEIPLLMDYYVTQHVQVATIRKDTATVEVRGDVGFIFSEVSLNGHVICSKKRPEMVCPTDVVRLTKDRPLDGEDVISVEMAEGFWTLGYTTLHVTFTKDGNKSFGEDIYLVRDTSTDEPRRADH